MTSEVKLKTVAPIADNPHKIERLDKIVQDIRSTSHYLQQNLFDLMFIPAWVDDEEEFLEGLIEDANFDINRIIDNANKIKEILPDED